MQNFKQLEQKIAEMLHSHFFIILPDCVWTSYLRENEAENLQNGDVHLAQIPDFRMGYLENHLAHWGQWSLIVLHFSLSFIWA